MSRKIDSERDVSDAPPYGTPEREEWARKKISNCKTLSYYFANKFIRYNSVRKHGVVDVDDLAQECLLALYDAYIKYDSTRGESFLSYASVACTRRMINICNKLKEGGGKSKSGLYIGELSEEGALYAHEDEPIIELEKRELQEAVSKALDKLPEDRRKSIEYVYLKETTQVEAGKRIGGKSHKKYKTSVPRKVVNYWVKSSLIRLKTLLKQYKDNYLDK